MRDSNGAVATHAVKRGLSGDLVRDAARRLGVVGLACAGGFASGFAVNVWFSRMGWKYGPQAANENWFNAAGVLVSLAMFALSRRASLTRAQFIGIGIAYEILGGLLIVLPDHNALVNQPFNGLFGISWLAVWIAVFAALLPTKPIVTVIVGVITATMSPLALWFNTLGGHAWPPAAAVAHMLIPNYIVAVFMGVPAIGLYRMSKVANEARDLGSYRLEERLGEGGMGEVWRASHRMLARPAAIKLIGSEALARANGVETKEMIRRFELEARSTALLSSPNTVALYDFGITDEGTLYYVMELLNGLDLDKLVTRFGPQPVARTVHFLLQMCESLDEAHANGLVHRDVKPANIHVSRLGRRYDVVKVLDFGLVKRRCSSEAAMSRLTIDENTRGTPAFMPPEMASGGVIDGRTDLYAVGCVAYWLLTGGMVFEGATLYEVVSHHMNTPPVPPSERTEIAIPAALDQVIMECLAKDPAERPGSARELARRLGAVPVADAWTTDRAETWWRMHLPEVVGV